MSWSRMHKAVLSLADRARCPAKDRLHSSENLDVKACSRSEDAHPATRSDVWPQSCLDKAKNILAWLKTIPTAVCGCNRTASKSRTTLRCSFRPTNQLEVVVIRSFGA